MLLNKMCRISWILIYFFILSKYCTDGYGERTKDQMYDKISTASACYRRLNATHQVGCSSKRGGSTGVVHYCESLDELDVVLTNGSAWPYIPVMPVKFWNNDVLNRLIKSQKISGLILYDTNETLEHFSHDHQCPNPLSSLQNTCSKKFPWNPYGTGLLFADIPFPIFYLEQEDEISKIKECYHKFNNYSFNDQSGRSLCSLELKSFMYATVNTPVCRRRSNIISNLNPVKFCDPVGDSNVWASLYPLVEGPKNETTPLTDHKYIIVAAKMDTTSMFEDTAGANNPVTSMVTLLATAKYLKTILKVDDINTAKLNVLFVFFNGETYDYIGSQRLLYDMKKGDFPVENSDGKILPIIKTEDIKLFIQYDQLGNSKDGEFFIHNLKGVNQVMDFYGYIQKYNDDTVNFELVNNSVPPTSLHTFLKSDPFFPGLIISDHKTNFTNKYYNSILDDVHNINFLYKNETMELDYLSKDSIQQLIAQVSVNVGKAIYREIKSVEYQGNAAPEDLVPLINELLHCYLENPNCKVLNATQNGTVFPAKPLNLYAGVDRHARFATTFTAFTLGWITGDQDPKNVNCTNKPKNYAYRYYNMSKSLDELNETVCFRMTMNSTDAISPAFKITNYNWTSGVYSTWAESTWKEIGVRMFLKPSASHERMSLAIGSISVIFSFILVYFINSRSQTLFTLPLPTEPPTDC